MKKNFNLIGKYLRGDAFLEERIQVMKWAEGNDTQRDEFNALRRIYDATLLMDDDIAMSKRRTGLRRYWKWLAAAAVIAFVAGISYLPENFRDDPTPHLQFRSLSAPIGQQTKTVLSDGTVVWLNSGSELEICEQAEGERRVKLCGEAYLDVARDIDRPFIVETSHMEVRVLGTRFNVNAYDEKQSVVLVSGSVDVTALEQGERAAAFAPKRCSPTTPAPGSGRYAWWIPIISFPGPKASSSSKARLWNRCLCSCSIFTEFGSIAIRT